MRKTERGAELTIQEIDTFIEGVAVARGESEVVLWVSEEQGLSLEFVAEQEVSRWKREVGGGRGKPCSSAGL